MTKDDVLDDSLWQATIYAAFQRAKIYAENVTEGDKQRLKKMLRESILKRRESGVYKLGNVSSTQHQKNISKIAKRIDRNFAYCLEKNSIPIGVVQKAFNLNLKLWWCAGKLAEPPHCPIDSIILKNFLIRNVKMLPGLKPEASRNMSL